MTEFKYTGRGDVFKAPEDGYYTFQLWGSPGGRPSNYNASTGHYESGRGGYVQIKIRLKRNQTIYAFVGSAGAASQGDSCAGGYNGGGAALVCTAGPHGASGGGATHISLRSNPSNLNQIYGESIIISDIFIKFGAAEKLNTSSKYSYDTIILNKTATTEKAITGSDGKLRKRNTEELKQYIRDRLKNDPYYGKYITDNTSVSKVRDNWWLVECHAWNNKDKVIAVAGGGGGGASNAGVNGGNAHVNNLNGKVFGYGGGTIAHPGTIHFRHSAYKNKLKAASNSESFGYTQGAGQYNHMSSGAGGGWWGGTTVHKYGREITLGGCGDMGGGGTSYIHSTTSMFDIDQSNSFTLPGNSDNLDSGTYKKPETIGVNGYIKVIKH